MTLSLLSPDSLLIVALLSVRLGAIIMSLPLFNSRSIPPQLKIIFIVTLSLGLYPLAQTQPLRLPQGLAHLAIMMLGEMLLGLAIGMVAQLLFAGIQLGGELMSQQMGLNIATFFDPQHAQQISLVTHFQDVMALLLFLSGGIHHWFILALAESLHRLPLAGFAVSEAVLPTLLSLFGKACVVAVQLAAPVSVALLLATLALGILARLVPQMNVFMLSFPLTFGLGLLVLSAALPYLLQAIQGAFAHLDGDLVQMMRALGAP
ncbi:MAG: flagellar biosynthetic protein FliR [Candidatus Tectimicrobiota bacterium]